MSGDMPEDIAERMSKNMSERMSEDMSERMSEDMSEEMSERYVRRYVRNHVKRKVRKNVRRYVRKNVKRYVRKNVRRYVRKNVKRYVRKNGKRYVRKNVRRYKDSCLHLVVSILLIASCFFALFGALQRRTAASTVGSTLFLRKEVSLVWQPWRRLWWNVLRRSSLGLPIRWPKELSMCGATS